MKTGNIIAIGVALLIIIGGIGIWQYRTLQIAHSTFENYYAFRGCIQLLEKTDTYGSCVTKSGQAIKIIKYEDRWFLDGDLPCKTDICW